MMHSLHTSPNAALVVAFGAESNIIDRLNNRNFKDKTVPILTRRAIVSPRSIKKLHRPVQATHLPTSPLFSATILSWGFKNSEIGKNWTRSVASPPHENTETISDPQDSSDASKEFISRSLPQAASHVKDTSDKNLESDECGFTNGRGSSSAENNVCSHASYSLVSDSVFQEDPDSVDRSQSDGRSPNAENDNQAESGNAGVREKEQGEDALMGGSEDNDQDIPSGRKRMGRPKRKKKKAYSAGIATYDRRTNSIRLKESATETPAASHRVDIKQQRQRSPRSSKSHPIEEGVQGVEVKSGPKDAPFEQVTGSVLEFNSENRSTGKSLGVEEGARLSRLLGLEHIDNIEENRTLITQDDARIEKFGYGGKVEPAVESNEGAPSQASTSDAPQVSLKSRPIKMFPGAKEPSKAKRFEQKSKPAKRDPKQKDVDVQAVASDEVDPCKKIAEYPQASEHLESKVLEPVLDVVPEPVVEQVGVIIDQVTTNVTEQVQQVRSNAFLATESVTSTAGQVAESISSTATQVSESVTTHVNEQVQQVQSNAFLATESVTSTAGQIAESISSTATQVSESVTKTAVKFSNSLTEVLKHGVDAEDEFEESSGSDRPEFRGLRGLKNYTVLQEDQGILVKLRDFYFFMMKKPLPEFALGMMAAPLALSTIFTLLYLPEFQGLAYDETVRDFIKASTGMDVGAIGLELSWMTFFQVFMFSLSLSTGLQPDIAPLSPYTLVVANMNALSAQLILAFLSAAVFARLSQPSEPVRCSSVALICSNNKRRGQTGQDLNKVLLTRCVLAGPQPCELVNVKVDLMYRFNTVSSEGAFFRGSYSLKLVRSQIALLDQGMLVRHIIDESSPLYSQTPQSLCENDAIFILSVGGLERSSMQPIFHVQFYSVCDEQVIWNAEFEDMILINQKNQRIVDHSKLSSWRSL